MVQNSLNAGPSFGNLNVSTHVSLLDNQPRIYVACLSSYANGILFGDWIDATHYLSIEIEGKCHVFACH